MGNSTCGCSPSHLQRSTCVDVARECRLIVSGVRSPIHSGLLLFVTLQKRVYLCYSHTVANILANMNI